MQDHKKRLILLVLLKGRKNWSHQETSGILGGHHTLSLLLARKSFVRTRTHARTRTRCRRIIQVARIRTVTKPWFFVAGVSIVTALSTDDHHKTMMKGDKLAFFKKIKCGISLKLWLKGFSDGAMPVQKLDFSFCQ